MRTFNREFGYRKRKHLVSCRLSDIHRWIPDDKKDCRTSSTGSSNNRTRGENLESYAPDIELLSSTTDLTGAQKPPFLHLKLETSPGDSQEDAGRHDFIHKPARLPLLAANDQGELPDNACPPLFGCDDKFHYNGTVLSPTPCETDKRGHHYIDDGHDVGVFQPVVVQPTRPPMFPFDAYEERCVCSKEGDASDNGLPPGIERPRHADVAEEEPSITLNESADLFPDESQRSTPTTGNEEAGSIPTVQSISSAWLHVSSVTTASREKVRSLDSRGVSVRLPVTADKETASPPCTTSRDTGNSSTVMTACS